VITVPITGLVNLDLDHLYNFELNGGIWDGGCVMLSLNGGGFVPVPAYAVYSNGYRGKLQSDELWAMSGLDVFSGSSGSSAVPANNLGIFLHTTAQLGNFNAGDTLQLQLRGGWDWFAAFTPGWIADNVQLTHVPEPCTLTLLGLGALGLLARRRRSR
jgi:hypothetical protein